MWLLLTCIVSCVLCSLASSRDIFDVTTVYDVRNFKTGYKGDNVVQGRIHVGKNARGFLLKDQHNTQIVPSAISSQLLLCDISDQELCTWKGFTVPSLPVGCPKHIFHPWRCKGSTKCISSNWVCEGENDCDGGSDEIGCNGRNRDDDFACPGTRKTRWVPASWKCDGQVDCIDGSDEVGCAWSKSFNMIGQEVVSPVLNLSAHATHQCLAIAFKLAQKSSRTRVLVLLAKLPDESTSQPLMSIESHGSGWNIQNVNISLQAYSKQAIRLVLKKTNIPIEISRISACSNNDEDVEILPPVKTRSDNPRSMPVYNIFTSTWEPPKLLSDPTKTCLNGGVLTTSGCACAPGFTGLECREGCGSGRFGQDCQSMCSEQLDECRGLLLCTYHTGCRCAPGYFGNTCNNSCLDGWYGNDCSLKCNCAPDSRCDVYTGKCEVCSLGYVPPYCLKASPRNIFDVTSVHDVKNFKTGYKGDNLVQGRIHVGKNARGFLLKDQHNSQIVPSAISSQLLLCDISDQELCTWKGFTVPSTSVGCPNDRPWRCKGSTHCIPWSFVCDYFANDCQAYNGNDSSDQIGCGEKPVSYDDFACPVYDRDRWAPASWMCDGQVDCTDGRDEIDCPVNKLNTMGQEVVSPVLNLSAAVTHQCLAIAFKLAQKSSNAPLALLAKLPDESTVPLMSIDSHESGWYIQNFNISLQAYSKQAIRLVLKKTNNITIEISRISACSNNDEDVEILPPVHTRSENLTSMQIYNIFTSTWEPPRLLSDPTKTCVNGGVLTTAGCACAPGFTGLECREGCGSNKFGQDCQSMCSEQLDECRGLLLCTYHTGCRCAPGYFGNTCNNSCLDGWYGNDCSLSCNCAPDSRCDIYTGKCEVCSLGYVPPYCLQEFVYCAASPVLSSMEYNTISVEFDANNVLGLGTPILYQLQYRQEAEEWRTYTIKLIPNDKSNIYETIIGLENGHIYEIRVLLIDSNFNKYDGPLVKASRIVTKCDIPEYYNYNVQSKFNISSVFLTWTYLNTTENWCPLEYFEVSWKENLLWRSRRTTAGNFTLGHLPGASIIFRVRAKTTAGFAPYSTQFAATNMSKGLQSVEQLRIVSIQFSSVELSWLPPSDHMGRSIQYKINYECVNRPACSLGCGDSQKGELSQTDTSLTLSYLLPFTQYRVTVTPEGGHRSSILVGTKGAVPSEIPTASSRPALCTNTSLTVFWEPVPVCSSFLRGYNYQLVKESESMKVLASGFTRNTNVTFSNLAVSSEYVVKVFIVNAAGVNPLAYLTINASRSATAPEAVRNLTVYKASRNMVGLRWAEPQATDLGPLQSFTVSVEGLAEGVLEKRVEPVHCAAWPELYCYTVDRLRPNKKYNFTVSARSRKVPEDWFPATIVALTKESYPTAPEHLQIVNVTAHDVLLRWQHPNLANGVIRSFLVNIEETDTFIQERCCQNFPIVEVNVNSEVEEYEAEVTGLRPASTYFMSVTAKTVGLGPSQSLSVTTRPPALPLTVTPPTSLVNATSWYQQDSGPTPTDDPGVYHALVKAHLLIHTYNSSSILPLSTATGIRDEQLDAFLKQIISTRFQFFAEYNQDGEVTDSKWGDRAFDEVVTGQPVAVQVTEYSGVYNADLAYSRGDTL